MMQKVIAECKRQGIFKQHREYIKAWLKHMDELEFEKKVGDKILNEVKRYVETKNKTSKKKIIELIWNESGTEAWIALKSQI